MRTLLVALDDPRARSAHQALLPTRTTREAAGARIVDMIRQDIPTYTEARYLHDFGRLNLYPTGHAKAGKGATEIDRLAASWCWLLILEAGYTDVVLFGARVKAAFADLVYVDGELGCGSARVGERLINFYALPHPSVRNPWYGEQENLLYAAKLLGSLRNHQSGARRRRSDP